MNAAGLIREGGKEQLTDELMGIGRIRRTPGEMLKDFQQVSAPRIVRSSPSRFRRMAWVKRVGSSGDVGTAEGEL